MKTNTKILLISTGFALPIFGWIYPSVWEWMDLPINQDMPAFRPIFLMTISAAVFFCVTLVLETFTKDDNT
jgi:hypothetical protein